MSLRRAARSVLYSAIGSFALSCGVYADDAAPKEAAVPLVVKVYPVADLVLPLARSADSSVEPDFESLIDLIELKTGADCWSEGGGHGSINPHKSTVSLVIRQTHAMHEHIADLLSEVRGTGDLAICAEVQFIRGDLDACESGSKPHRSAEGLVDAAGKQRLIHLITAQKDGTIAYAPKITFFNGHNGSIEITDEHGGAKFDFRGVVSKDNRYTRLWIDTTVAGQTTSNELLIPEGHTAVRKLPGENSWLLVTSHVINAEEPERIAPTKAHPPAADQKRYLVPVDDTPDPSELTSVPAFKGQAQEFGVEVASRVHQVAAEQVVCDSGDEKACAAWAHQPCLAPAIDLSEYKVAVAEPEPGHCTGQGPEPKTAIGFAILEDSAEPTGSGHILHSFGADHVHGFPSNGILSIVSGLHPGAVITHGDMRTGHDDPPARLDVKLDDSLWRDGAIEPVAVPGRLFHHVFTQPTSKDPTSSLDHKEADRAHGHVFRVPTGTVQIVPSPPSLEIGRRAILSSPKAYPHPEYGVIVEQHVLQSTPAPHVDFFYAPSHAPFAPPPVSKVTPVSGESREHASPAMLLRKAAEELRRQGLHEEAKSVLAVIESVSLKARERSAQIDLEIARLMAEKERLEALTGSTRAAQPSNEVIR